MRIIGNSNLSVYKQSFIETHQHLVIYTLPKPVFALQWWYSEVLMETTWPAKPELFIFGP